ncbi:MAG: sulfite exporter TauE/SafE family protein [Myxococcota bacterium]
MNDAKGLANLRSELAGLDRSVGMIEPQGVDESVFRYLAVCGAGLVAGVVNTLAGGGSFLTLPALIYFGLPADVANGTNRIGVLLQNTAAAAAFHRQGHVLLAWAPILWSCVGAAVGVTAAALIDAEILEPIFGALLILGLPLLFVRVADARGQRRPALEAFGLLGAGFYGGFIQAGVGVILLLILVGVRGIPVQNANPIKVLLVAIFTVPAVLVFTLQDKMDWLAGGILAAGTMVGAVLGAYLKVPPVAVKLLVAALVLIAGLDMLLN